MSRSNGLVLFALAACAAAGTISLSRRGPTPNLPFDPNTPSSCSWWWDQNQATPCQDILDANFIALADFRRWNPSVNADCSNVNVGFSYCVEDLSVPPTTTTSSTTTGSPTTTAPPVTGTETPQPIQPGMVANCDAFHFVQTGQGCETIAGQYGITVEQFSTWNPNVGSTCGGLWANVYVCVSIIGHSAPPTTTAPPNGITTPSPIQPGMVSNCDAFHFVATGQTCATITGQYGITLAQFTAWNPNVGSTCGGMWANVFVCVSIIGHTPPPTTTAPPNGITTPTPIQPGMVNNCDAFYLVRSGNDCTSIAASHGISLANFYLWNPAVGNTCSGLWLDTYVCVSIIGHTPTPTSTGNGITTPTPTQTGMVGNCRRFHFVAVGEICASIVSRYGITLANFVRWNPAVRSDCSGMWAQTYVCVGL